MLPSIVRHLNREASEADLEIVPRSAYLISVKDRQNIAVAVCAVTDTPMSIHDCSFGEDRLVCVVGESDPMATTDCSVACGCITSLDDESKVI